MRGEEVNGGWRTRDAVRLVKGFGLSADNHGKPLVQRSRRGRMEPPLPVSPPPGLPPRRCPLLPAGDVVYTLLRPVLFVFFFSCFHLNIHPGDGLNCIPLPDSYIEVLTSYNSECDLIWGQGLYRGYEVKMRSLGGL